MGTTYTVSGSWAWMSIGKPKSVGRLPLTSTHESAPSSLRMTSQCFCMNRTFGRPGAWRCDGRNDRPRRRVGDSFGLETAVDRRPGRARRRSTGTRRRPRWRRVSDPGSDGSRRIVWRHIPPAPGCQSGPEPWPRSPDSSVHFEAAVDRTEQGGVLHARVDGLGIGRRGFEVPHPLEFPWMRRAVVPLVRSRQPVVLELVADRRPRPPAIIRALDELSEPDVDCDA